MAWRIEITGAALRDLEKLDQSEAKRILAFLRQRLQPQADPRQLGKPLQGNLAEFWRYRVGKYRLICELRDEALLILVVRLGKRGDIYR